VLSLRADHFTSTILLAKLIIVAAPFVSAGIWWTISKAREHALLDKAKEKAASLQFWKNVFAVVGVIATLFLILSFFANHD
jgi:hypothetical protein